MRLGLSVALILGVLAAIHADPTDVLAHSGAKGVVMERMELMKSIGKTMKSISQMARGKASLDPGIVFRAANDIAIHSQRLDALFPEGSGQGVTRASPTIWQDREGFRQSANRLSGAADALRAAAMRGDPGAIKAAYGALGKTCGGCHKRFRIKKNR